MCAKNLYKGAFIILCAINVIYLNLITFFLKLLKAYCLELVLKKEEETKS